MLQVLYNPRIKKDILFESILLIEIAFGDCPLQLLYSPKPPDIFTTETVADYTTGRETKKQENLRILL